MIIFGTSEEVEILEREIVKQTGELYALSVKVDGKLSLLENSWKDNNYVFFQERIHRILQLIDESLEDIKDVQVNLGLYRELLEKYSSDTSVKSTSNIISPLSSYRTGASLDKCNRIREIGAKAYFTARQLASKSEAGAEFTNHTEKHTEMVRQKSLEVCATLKEAFHVGCLKQSINDECDLPFGFECDEEVLSLAALLHDTCMCGKGYVVREDGIFSLDTNNFGDVRKNHSFNSGLFVLQQRESLKKIGYSDEQIDAAAMACVVHSKSSSGISNLNSSKQWKSCFEKVHALVKKYNGEHPENKISFESAAFEKSTKKLGDLAMLSFALRVGDVSRDSCAGDIGQSEETIDVVLETINKGSKNFKKEIEGAVITRGTNKKSVTSEKSRQVHVGEQNIRLNNTIVSKKEIVHEIKVRDAELAPHCTWIAISDHLGELLTAKALQFRVNVVFDQSVDDATKQRWKRERRKAAVKYKNALVYFKWKQ